jgi:hypothetical protein
MAEKELDIAEKEVNTVEDADASTAALEVDGGEGATEEPNPSDEPRAEEASESLEITFGGEKPADTDDQVPAPKWVREVRKQNRELLKQNRELERRLSEAAEKPPAALSEKPTLDKFDYDAAKYELALSSWYESKRKHEEAEARKRAEVENTQAEWQKRLASYGQAKGGLGVADYEDAEGVVQALFDVTQQGIIVQGAENPALVVYALGKNEAKAKQLAGIKDPVQFAFAVAKLEASMRVNRKSAPAPEKPVAGATRPGGGGGADAQLSRLRADAERTGDYSKVASYKRQLRNKGR